MLPDLADDLALMLAAAADAAQLAMSFYGRPIEIMRKPDGSPVTAADLAVDALLRARFAAARPDYGWLSEESEDDRRRLGAPRTVIVDPIDGTRAFTETIPQWTISIGLAEGDAAVAGVIVNPAQDETFAAVTHRGATLNGAPIRCTARGAIAGARFLAGASLLRRREFNGAFAEADAVWVNSVAYRMASVAAGRADATISLSPKREWDIAAACVLLAEAGGIATDIAGRPFRFNQADTRSVGPVASGEALHPLLLAAVEPAVPAQAH